MAATTNKVVAIDYSIVNKAVTKANKNKSINLHKEAAKLARKAAKKATEEGNYHLANHYHKIYEHHNEMANMRKSETKDNPRDMGKNYNDEGGASEHIPTHLKQLLTKISDEEHTKGTPYYKPTQKSEKLSKMIDLNEKRNKEIRESKPVFNIGDNVRFKEDPSITGQIQKISSYVPHEKTFHYHIRENNGKINRYSGHELEPYEKSETETRLAVLAKGIQAAITLRGLVKAEKEAFKDRYIVRFNDGKSASKKEFTKKGAAHSHALKKIDDGYDHVTLHHYSVDNPTKETKLEIKSSSGGNK